MQKKELVDKIAEKSGGELKKGDIEKTLNILSEVVIENLRDAGEIKLGKLGKFVASHRKERVCRNPQTGESISVPAKTVPAFKASNTFKTGI